MDLKAMPTKWEIEAMAKWLQANPKGEGYEYVSSELKESWGEVGIVEDSLGEVVSTVHKDMDGRYSIVSDSWVKLCCMTRFDPYQYARSNLKRFYTHLWFQSLPKEVAFTRDRDGSPIMLYGTVDNLIKFVVEYDSEGEVVFHPKSITCPWKAFEVAGFDPFEAQEGEERELTPIERVRKVIAALDGSLGSYWLSELEAAFMHIQKSSVPKTLYDDLITNRRAGHESVKVLYKHLESLPDLYKASATNDGYSYYTFEIDGSKVEIGCLEPETNPRYVATQFLDKPSLMLYNTFVTFCQSVGLSHEMLVNNLHDL